MGNIGELYKLSHILGNIYKVSMSYVDIECETSMEEQQQESQKISEDEKDKIKEIIDSAQENLENDSPFQIYQDAKKLLNRSKRLMRQ